MTHSPIIGGVLLIILTHTKLSLFEKGTINVTPKRDD